MSDISEAKKNQGVLALNVREHKEDVKTIIVVGVARGGTSIVAGTLHKLGVFMGGAQSPVYEDLKLSLAYERKSKDKFDEVIEEYNQKSSVWAWKRPSSLKKLKMISKKVRNPYFIFVFRDLVSVSNRNTISMKVGFKGGLLDAFRNYGEIIKFVSKTNYPSLFVSSEKAVSNKENFLDSICDFCDLVPSLSQREQALNFISPNPKEYLSATRIDCSRGWVDTWQLQAGLLQGWAYFPNQLNKKARVQIKKENGILATVDANQPITVSDKVHQIKANIYGFQLDLKELGISPKDEVIVSVVGDDIPLPQSPISCQHLLSGWLSKEELDKLSQPRGHVGIKFYQTGILFGWAVGRNKQKPANVSVKVNGEILFMVPASIYRPNLKKRNVHPTGQCGFEVNLKQYGVKPSDEVSVTLEEDNYVLCGALSYPDLEAWYTYEEWRSLEKKPCKNLNKAS